MDGLTITSAVAGAAPEQPKPTTAADAAKQFEALLLGQMLHSAHESEDQEDPTGDTMWDVAAQKFAQVMADNGGLGLAKLIERGLTSGTPRSSGRGTVSNDEPSDPAVTGAAGR